MTGQHDELRATLAQAMCDAENACRSASSVDWPVVNAGSYFAHADAVLGVVGSLIEAGDAMADGVLYNAHHECDVCLQNAERWRRAVRRDTAADSR